jgi:hypothetical protein
MGSHKNHNLNVNEDFVIFLTSKLISFFIDGFTSGMKSQSMAYLLGASGHIYWIRDLEGECIQYGICSQAAFKNARAMFFLKLGRGGQQFSIGFQKCRAGAKDLRKGCPRPDLTPPIVRRGDLMSALSIG